MSAYLSVVFKLLLDFFSPPDSQDFVRPLSEFAQAKDSKVRSNLTLIFSPQFPNEYQLKTLFSNALSIREFNFSLLCELGKRLDGWKVGQAETQCLGDIFVQRVCRYSISSFLSQHQAPFLQLYKDYVSNYGAALKQLKELKEDGSSEFNEWLETTVRKNTYDLLDLLITPVQRTFFLAG